MERNSKDAKNRGRVVSVRGIEQILLFYNSPTQGASYRAKAQQLLPVDPRWLKKLEQRTWPMRGLPTYTLDWDTLYRRDFLLLNYFLNASCNLYVTYV